MKMTLHALDFVLADCRVSAFSSVVLKLYRSEPDGRRHKSCHFARVRVPPEGIFDLRPPAEILLPSSEKDLGKRSFLFP